MFRNWVTDTYISADRNVASGRIFYGVSTRCANRRWANSRNEWYPRGLQISLHIRSPGLQDYSEVWNLKFFRFLGGVFWNSRIWNLWQFSLGGVFWNSWIWTLWQLGGYSETLGFGIFDNFHFGGYSETLGFGLSDNFHWGGIPKLSDLESLTILGGGRVFCTTE